MSTMGPGLLNRMREYFESGATRPISFRKEQLRKLKAAIYAYEKEIGQAIYADLKKSAEEVYSTETGLLIAEINVTLSHLDEWTRPKNVGTNLMNLPSSSKIYRDPLGVIFIIAPWNYPFQLSLIPLVGAIAGGNCALIKPSELAPATSAILDKIIGQIYSTEYIAVIEGDGAELVPSIMKSFRFDHIFYTGSIPVGKAIYQLAAADLIPVTLELGGKNPAIVENDAKIAVTVKRIAVGKFINAGQICVAPDYVLVHTDIQQEFVDAMKKTLQDFYGERPIESNEYGKIINERRFNKLLSYLSSSEIIYGGQHDKSKLFISPTIILNPALDSGLMSEEIFGPILPVVSFRTMDDAKKIIRLNPNPLSLYVFTSDQSKEKAWIEQIPFGGGCINNAAWQFTNPHLPFGGIGQSGMGAYHGKYSFDLFTHAKPVMKTPVWIDPSIKYPPYSGKLKWFKRLIR
ncbi:MAG: aldehyde dehydrogenase [Chitinophagales bacterium]